MSSIKQYRRWLGRTVRFSKRNREGRRMIDQGIREGVILGVRRTKAGDVRFEINFGIAGNPKHSEFSRRAFYLPSRNGVHPSAAESATG